MATTDHPQDAGTNERRLFCVRIPLAEHRRVKGDAKREGVSMAEYCRRALIWYLANRARPAEPAKAAKKMGTIPMTLQKTVTYKPTKPELA